MGSAASVGCHIENLNVLIMDKRLQDGIEQLRDDYIRAAFVEFIKNGSWVDKIVSSKEKMTKKSHEERLAQEKKNAVYAYKGAPARIRDIAEGLSQRSNDTCSWANTGTKSRSGSFPKVEAKRNYASRTINSADHLEESCGMTCGEITAMMITIVLPIFLNTEYHRIFRPDGNASISSNDDSISGNSKLAMQSFVEYQSQTLHHVPANTRTPVQDLLLSCAEVCDEDALLCDLEDPAWMGTVAQIVDEYPLSITICDVSEEGCPIVFANKAMTKLTGYSKTQLIGHGFSLLHGATTEPHQAEAIQLAMQRVLSDKVAVTHYNKQGRPYTNLFACQPVSCFGAKSDNRYSIGVHFTETSGPLKCLEGVDDILSLLSLIVKNKPLKEEFQLPIMTNMRPASTKEFYGAGGAGGGGGGGLEGSPHSVAAPSLFS
mmetsp:Transcript_19322/g.32306  ORF Transcript_19322/g.32306 Transcript_19322/m.32306 type:complete len:431 (+) Transcript_19322:108-1400(+)|eukprot:CAMPEP_0174967016 /NCGR_PEP_ID=MMETSP0004_2-20121128/7355_1 /TAXON_ID=420556 /ORGANISM="Ochromonas sp., Strain CCMP1393" /LENGTH=430 /DNA_ID=CAMNT_0016216113 /DNA_START=106 /DNA_END=1401 /DNA_ORIENTATION=+